MKQPVVLLLILALLSGCSQRTPTTLPPTQVVLSSPTEQVPTISPEPTAAPQIAESLTWQTTDAGAIQFQPNATAWYTPGDLAPNTAIRFALSALQGQQLTVRLTTEPSSEDVPLAVLYITDSNGQVLTPNPVTYWSGILQSTQEFSIEIRSLAQQQINYTLFIEIPAALIDPALGEKYDLISLDICQMIREAAAQAIGVDFALEDRAPFLDVVAGEAGQGCRLTAFGDGNTFADPQAVVKALIGSAGLGWAEQLAYQAGGPTGSSAGLTRDMALMLITANWSPVMGVECPSDQPIASCDLAPDQKVYTIRINIAQYRTDFSLDGHWENADTGFSLDLYQDWKTIYGTHAVVAQGGNKIDSLELSINGNLQGQVATVQFQSSFTDQLGTAQITCVDVNTILWKIIDPPTGEFYLPAEAVLTRN